MIPPFLVDLVDKNSRNKELSKAHFREIEIKFNLLKKNKEEYNLPKFYLAGGYLRDIILGNVPKDMDFFVLNLPPDELEDSCVLYTVGHPFNKSAFIEDGYPREETSVDNKVFCVYNIRGLPGSPVQIIGRTNETLLDMLDSFDYNMCKIALDDEYNLFVHPDFEEGLNTRTIDVRCERSVTFARNSGFRLPEVPLPPVLPHPQMKYYFNLATTSTTQSPTMSLL